MGSPVTAVVPRRPEAHTTTYSGLRLSRGRRSMDNCYANCVNSPVLFPTKQLGGGGGQLTIQVSDRHNSVDRPGVCMCASVTLNLHVSCHQSQQKDIYWIVSTWTPMPGPRRALLLLLDCCPQLLLQHSDSCQRRGCYSGHMPM